MTTTHPLGTTAAVIEAEMQTVIFYLTAFGYIDGRFDEKERGYIQEFIKRLVAYRVRVALKDSKQEEVQASIEHWTAHFQKEFEHIDHTIQSHFTESVAEGEDTREFVVSKLKLRCFELFKRFNAENQRKLLALADELIAVDGETDPKEVRFREDLANLLEESAVEDAQRETLTGRASMVPGIVRVFEPVRKTPRVEDYKFFQAFEWNYKRVKDDFSEQIKSDITLVDKTIEKLKELSEKGRGKLDGKQRVEHLAGEPPFLDRYVHYFWPEPGKEYELLVLGDLHGCYSCLKAALLQSDFFSKVDAHHLNPDTAPCMKLVLLGDYIDRGRFSYDGILRTAMQLFLRIPDHVYMLRGNHEYYIEHNGRIYGGVRPAEAIESITGLATEEVFGKFKRLFESLPNALLFERLLFAHAGIPRDKTVGKLWKDLSSLNEGEVRFQMLWSDPSEARYIPEDMQEENARFPFGKEQFKSFMRKLGCTTMIRGHERVDDGFVQVYDDGVYKLFTLFSAGGEHNEDLPPTSNYREVTPMALTIRYKDNETTVEPFYIDYERYNTESFNGFRKK